MKKLNELNIEELKYIRYLLLTNSNEILIEEINKIIKEREEQEDLSWNKIMTLDWLFKNNHISQIEKHYFEKLGLKNVQDIVDFDLRKVDYSYPSYIKESLQFIKDYLDMSRLEKNNKKNKK